MAYVAPYVDSTGLHLPTYSDIRDDIITKTKDIYGQDIYLGEDSQDYQFISTFSLMLYDAMQSVLLAYNNANPITAISTGLDRLVALNGIVRREATASTCTVTLTGLAGTIITNGVVQDINNINWELPASVTIGGGGTVNVIATCTQLGAVQVPVGGLNKIVTPVSGWQSVTNADLAVLGTAVEKDSELRARQAISAAISARTVMDSILSAILNIAGVTKAIGYENDTANTVGVYPPHSITMVVLGGDETEIATQIYYRKSLGAATYGDTSVTIEGQYGQSNIIKFQRPSTVTANVAITINKLASYNSDVLPLIKTAVTNYINSLKIGEDLYISNLYSPIMVSVSGYTTPPFYVSAMTVNSQDTVVNLTDFDNLVASVENITITVA